VITVRRGDCSRKEIRFFTPVPLHVTIIGSQVRVRAMLGLALILFLASSPVAAAPYVPPVQRVDLLEARRFMVQLQNIHPAAVERADPDVLVVDYSWDGGPRREMTRDDVRRLKTRDGADRVVLAYMSVGEAENYRFYWTGPAGGGRAGFIIRPNRRWRGNYLVRYWDPEWHSILYGGPDSYLDRILAQGFDGVFLDTVDTAEALQHEGDKLAVHRMADLVKAIARKARSVDPDFLVLAQNPYCLMKEEGVMEALSGVSAEAGLFKGERLSPRSVRDPLIRTLAALRHGGKAVAVIEYVRSRKARGRLLRICADNGFMCYAGRRHLGGVGWIVEP